MAQPAHPMAQPAPIAASVAIAPFTADAAEVVVADLPVGHGPVMI